MPLFFVSPKFWHVKDFHSSICRDVEISNIPTLQKERRIFYSGCWSWHVKCKTILLPRRSLLSNEKILNKFHLICIRLGIAPWNIHINGYRKFDSVQYRSRYTCQFETSIYFWVLFSILFFYQTRSKLLTCPRCHDDSALILMSP